MSVQDEDRAQPQPDEIAPASADPSGPTIDETDPDVIELRAAQAAADAENAAGQGSAQNDGQPAGQQPQHAPTERPAEGQGDAQSPMIPKPRFDDVLGRLRATELENARLQGMLDAGRGQGQPQGGGTGQGQQPAPQPTADDRIAAIDARADAAAKQYDDGTLSYAELLKVQRAAEREANQIREEQFLARVQKPAAGAAPQEDGLLLDQYTADLETKHPYSLLITEQRHWNFLINEAVASFEAEGVTIPQNDRGKLMMRARVAELTDRYGEQFTGQKLQVAGQPAPQPSKPGTAATDRRTKLEAQNDYPPNVAGMAGAGATGAEVTEDQIADLSDEEIMKLPAAARNRILGMAI